MKLHHGAAGSEFGRRFSYELMNLDGGDDKSPYNKSPEPILDKLEGCIKAAKKSGYDGVSEIINLKDVSDENLMILFLYSNDKGSGKWDIYRDRIFSAYENSDLRFWMTYGDEFDREHGEELDKEYERHLNGLWKTESAKTKFGGDEGSFFDESGEVAIVNGYDGTEIITEFIDEKGRHYNPWGTVVDGIKAHQPINPYNDEDLEKSDKNIPWHKIGIGAHVISDKACSQ